MIDTIGVIFLIIALVLWGYFFISIWMYGSCHNKTKKIYYSNLNNSEKELDRLCKLEKKWTYMFDSDTRVGLALLDEIRKLNNNHMLQRYIQKTKHHNENELHNRK